jgi:hypothetical protein
MRRGSWRLTDGRGRPSSREEPVEAAGAADAKSTRPPLLGKLQNSFPRASTGLLSSFGGDISIELRTGTFLTSLDIDFSNEVDPRIVQAYVGIITSVPHGTPSARLQGQRSAHPAGAHRARYRAQILTHRSPMSDNRERLSARA